MDLVRVAELASQVQIIWVASIALNKCDFGNVGVFVHKQGDDLERLKNECVNSLLALCNDVHCGHIGSSLSCLDVLIAVVFGFAREEDMLILSKGHAASALYTVYAKAGYLSQDQLKTFYKDGTLLGAHPPLGGKIEKIPFGTGSLGHGLSLAAGVCLAQRFTGKSFKVFCVLSDGECNEGSIWEAAMFSAHHKLDNLYVIIDKNGLQGLGRTTDILDMGSMSEKWKSFGFEVLETPQGNSPKALIGELRKFSKSGVPKCLVAETIKGNGIDFMANRFEWHYLPMTDAQYADALKQVNKYED